MQVRIIVTPDGSRDAALRVLRVAFVDGALRQHADRAVLSRHQRRIQPGDAGTDDQVVVALRHGLSVTCTLSRTGSQSTSAAGVAERLDVRKRVLQVDARVRLYR